MAGIAFRLQKLLAGESYTDVIKAYLYSSVISSGPFLMVILTMAALKGFTSTWLGLNDASHFMGLVIYAYCFSMIGVSPFGYVVTRYLADRHFLGEKSAFTPSYLSILEMTFVAQGLIVAWFLYPMPLRGLDKLVLFGLYLILSGIWIAMIFLSAARDYISIIVAFALSFLGAVAGVLFMGKTLGLTGFLLGFTAGQFLCFAILTWRIFREFGFVTAEDHGFYPYFYKHYRLIFIGLFYYVGLMADKMVFWLGPDGESILPGIRLNSQYDVPLFMAYLAVIPSMAFFLIQMETSFAVHCHSYYDAVRSRNPLSIIRARRLRMIEDLTRQFQKFVVFQGAITSFVIIFIEEIAQAFMLSPAQLGVFRISLLGTFLHMALMMIINVLFYFDLQKEILRIVTFFLVSNILFSWASLSIGLEAHGFGYTLSCFVSLIAGFILLDRRLHDLDYLTFMKQPVVSVMKPNYEGDR